MEVIYTYFPKVNVSLHLNNLFFTLMRLSGACLETMLDDSWVIVETGEAEDSQTNTEEDKVEREEREEGDWSGQKWSKYV